jgi:hypothetical protein
MPTIAVSDDELRLVIEALNDNAGVFDEGATDDELTDEEREAFARDAERCRALATRLASSH